MKSNFRQVILPLNLEIKISDIDPVRLLNDICDQLDYSNLYKTYCRAWRKYDPVTLFKILVYGYMNGKYSCRDLENACMRDIYFMWLLNGMQVPDATTFARFQNEKLVEVIEELFYQLINKLAELKEGKVVRTKSWTGRQSFEGSMYTKKEKEKEKALALYDTTKSIAEVIRRLGYPSRQAMYTWIANRNKPKGKRKSFRGINTAEHPRHTSAELRQYRTMSSSEKRRQF